MHSSPMLTKLSHFIDQAIRVFHENQILFGVVAIVLVIVFLLVWSFWLPRKAQ